MDKPNKNPLSSKDKIKLVKTVYSYLMLVIGIIMLSIGFVRAVTTISNFLFLDEYPYSGEEYRTEMKYAVNPEEVELSEEELAKREAEYDAQVELSRQKAKVVDVSVSTAMLILGTGIIYVHAKMAKGLDQDK